MVDYLNYEWLRANGQNIRVHGNRFIQIDLREGDERVHVWHDLVPFAQKYGTPIHDHVFGFHSRILAGTLIDIRYKVTPSVGKTLADCLFNVLRYDVYSAKPRTGSDTALVKSGELVTVELSSVQAMPAGMGYIIRPREFHTTAYVGYAVTRIRKTEVIRDTTPRVLCPATMSPDHEFERYKYKPDELWGVVWNVLKQANQEMGHATTEGSIPV